METEVFKMPSKPKLESIKPKAKPKPKARPRRKSKPNVSLQPQPQQYIQPQVMPLETQYILRSVSRMETDIIRLWTSNKFIDIILVCDGQQFHCHRLIVAAASRLIENLLTENTSNNPIVIIPFGVKAHIMKLLIDFMYTGATLVAEGGLQELVESAKLLQVTGLYDAKTKCQECLVDIRGVSHVVENRQSVMDHVAQIERRMQIKQQVDLTDYPDQTDACNQRNEDIVMVDVIEIDDDDDIPDINQGHVVQQPARGMHESTARISSCDKGKNTAQISNSNTKLFCNNNPITETTNIVENVSIRRISKSQPQKPPKDVEYSTQPNGKLMNMFGQHQLSELQLAQPSTTTNTVLSNTVSWHTQFASTSAPMVPIGIKLAPVRTNLVLTNPPTLLKLPENTFRVPFCRSQFTIKNVSPAVPKTTPFKVALNYCRNTPSTIVRDSSTSAQVRAISPQMPQLLVHPRLKISRVRSNSPSETSSSCKRAKRVVTEKEDSGSDSAPPPFLKLRVPPTRARTPISYFEGLESPEELRATIYREYAENAGRVAEIMRISKQGNQEEAIGELHRCYTAGVPESAPIFISGQQTSLKDPLNEFKIDKLTKGKASFVEENFPIFFGVQANDKQGIIPRENVINNELGQQLLTKQEAMAIVRMLNQDDVETVLCHPTLPYFDEYYDEIDNSKVIDIEKEMHNQCIDYDRLVAETYTEDEEELHQQGKRQESNLDEQTSFYYSSEIIPYSIPKFRKRKYPPKLVPLSVMHAKQFYYNRKLNTEENGDINFREDPSIFGDADLLPVLREGDPHSPNAVILRNPRCNQPRNYSTESLYNALMAVKYGESIYRASRLHDVPRKTLRNWMKRFNIKSKHPMPKQLQNAANNNRKKDSMLLSRASIAVAKSDRVTRNTKKRPARTCTVTSTTATLSISEDSGFKGFPEGDYTFDI